MLLSSIDINGDFRHALDIMENSSSHVFITGKAGTGKSTLLNFFRHTTHKVVAVLAPTGVAALNVQGQTIHSFFGFKPSITPEKVKKVTGSKGDIYREITTIVIDEISMVRADLLDCVEKFLRLNGPRKKEWFGGIQMVFIGDLYQLPPVVSGSEKEIFTHRYETPYFFSAQVFREPSFTMDFVELEKVYRQTQADFIDLLNSIRNRTCTDEDLHKLNSRLDPNFIPSDDQFYVTLTSTNDLASNRNLEKLNSLPGKVISYKGVIKGFFDRSSLPTEETLMIKRGAQVMLTSNNPAGLWVNGTVGRISGIIKDDNDQDRILVTLRNGDEVDVEPNTWDIFEYQYDRETKKITTLKTGAFTQYPIRLAWAVTIHKSQGKTFDSVVIDIGRGTFAHGQMYVALSRCTNFEGITLTQQISKSHIRMDWRVSAFLTRFQYKKADERHNYEDKRTMIEDAIKRGINLEILYLKPDDTKSRRIILPVAIEEMDYRGKSFEGLRAYCHLKKGERNFKIDRILEMTYSV